MVTVDGARAGWLYLGDPPNRHSPRFLEGPRLITEITTKEAAIRHNTFNAGNAEGRVTAENPRVLSAGSSDAGNQTEAGSGRITGPAVPNPRIRA